MCGPKCHTVSVDVATGVTLFLDGVAGLVAADGDLSVTVPVKRPLVYVCTTDLDNNHV